MKPYGLLACACLLVGLTGCTAQLWYASGQSWQRNECFKLVNATQRNQCLQRTWLSYDQYKHELHMDQAAREHSTMP